MARVHAVTGTRAAVAPFAWECVEVPLDPEGGFGAGGIGTPDALARAPLAWRPAKVPGTAAMAFRPGGPPEWALGKSLDASDYWFRTRFTHQDGPGLRTLSLGGIASASEVWLNGERILESDSMFHAHRLDVTARLREENELAIRVHALSPLLSQKRPRPRWRTRLVKDQQLRWFRTSLLGRIPAWSPPIPCVGPYRPVTLEAETVLAGSEVDLRTRVDGAQGVVQLRLRVRAVAPLSAGDLEAARLHVGGSDVALTVVERGSSGLVLEGRLSLPEVALWWPHTHGPQPLHPVRVALTFGGHAVEIDLGTVGFRTLEVTGQARGGWALRVNGADVFARGACWTPLDMASFGGSPEAYAEALRDVAAAGMNMIRVGGTMAYEDDAFYDACTASGVMVWQDFMFANLDYPGGDPAFLASVEREVVQFLSRTQAAPCLAVFCGNSEVEQQVAMLGFPRESWTQPLFTEVLPRLVSAHRGEVPYVPSTPTYGALPFQVDQGISHYYGVGAYLRPLEDARRAEVKFTSECLGFSNVPEDVTLEKVLEGGEAPAHHPAWKARVPRDGAAGWDFEDVRDYYLRLLFEVDPVALRYSDPARYLALGRVTTAEVMARTLEEWRRPRSPCAGALVWFLRDLWPGAGWGVIDSTGLPKAAYYGLRRAQQPLALLVSDEGLNGLAFHVVNETPEARELLLRVALLRDGHLRVAEGARELGVPARGSIEVRGDALFDHFLDTTYAYRFGPPGHEVTVATLEDRTTGRTVAEAFHFPRALPRAQSDEVGLEATVEARADDIHEVTLVARRFAQSVALEVRGFVPDDNYFHLAPGAEKRVVFRRLSPKARFQGTAHPLNARAPTKIVFTGPLTRPAPSP